LSLPEFMAGQREVGSMLLYNHWYVAAWSSEIERKPLARTLLNDPVVLYRTEDNRVIAMEDRCPHRQLPLSMGKLVGDKLQCHYHGFQFDPLGKCVRIPGQEAIPSSAFARTFPVVERYRWVWIWMGDPALADPDLIPDYHWMEDENWGAKGTYLHVQANWQLIVDNLLDLTHLAFVHETTIGNAAVADHAAVKVTRTPNGVLVTRWMIDKPAPPTYVKAGKFTTNVDRWQFIDFTPPAFLRLHVGANPTGTGAQDGNFAGGINMRNLNCITPESETTAHYFWAQAHDFEVGNLAVTNMLFEQVKTAFLEDVAVFEAQQKSISARPQARQVDINADAGGIQARRILSRLHREELERHPANASIANVAAE
jgi:phenylpropionate dioxygenase-like ring-hydroxylating dioxygenase large terminal subunit